MKVYVRKSFFSFSPVPTKLRGHFKSCLAPLQQFHTVGNFLGCILLEINASHLLRGYFCFNSQICLSRIIVSIYTFTFSFDMLDQPS